MTKKLHIDVETYSSEDIKVTGHYRYTESFDFEILIIAYAFDDGIIKVVDLAQGEGIPAELQDALQDETTELWAHNASFERRAFEAIGIRTDIKKWRCSAVKSAYCGLPHSLGQVSKALELGEKGKSSTGTALIKYFAVPCKPTKVNGGRFRNLPEHAPDKWQDFKDYCAQDVEAEREICGILKAYSIPESEQKAYAIDQRINDRGILLDAELARAAFDLDEQNAEEIAAQICQITGIKNANSLAQLKAWFKTRGLTVSSLAKEALSDLLASELAEDVREVLELRQRGSKTSIKKYTAMLNCVARDGRLHGLLQFFGAGRTGRWAGRLVQLQNLPQNHLADLDHARTAAMVLPLTDFKYFYPEVSNTLSQLIRTAFIADKGKVLAVADWSAIEARVIAWLAGERWRMEVFRTHGKIYEASASKMFNVPIEAITKDSPLRQKGKVAELALGYQGSVGALIAMGAEAMGLDEREMKIIVNTWRKANPAIVAIWADIYDCAKSAFSNKGRKVLNNTKKISFLYDGKILMCFLPSGRQISYYGPAFGENKFGSVNLRYKGPDPKTSQWAWTDTYGGKLVENIVQAIARDLMAFALENLEEAGFEVVIHVHDEAGAEVDEKTAEADLQKMCEIMGTSPAWALDLPLVAEGYTTKYYKKG